MADHATSNWNVTWASNTGVTGATTLNATGNDQFDVAEYRIVLVQGRADKQLWQARTDPLHICARTEMRAINCICTFAAETLSFDHHVMPGRNQDRARASCAPPQQRHRQLRNKLAIRIASNIGAETVTGRAPEGQHLRPQHMPTRIDRRKQPRQLHPTERGHHGDVEQTIRQRGAGQIRIPPP